MLIMVSGPYRSDSDDPDVWKENLRSMNEAAYEVFKKGHTPLIGVNAALPIIAEAGEDKYEEIMMPISLALANICDAVLRIGGDSKGAVPHLVTQINLCQELLAVDNTARNGSAHHIAVGFASLAVVTRASKVSRARS